MLLNYIKVEKKDNILIEKYVELLNSGIDSSSILVLVQNSTQRKKFSEEVFQNIKIPAFEKLNIHSFHSIVYNTLNDNWCFIENSIPSNKTFILPNLVGLEISQFLLKDILKKIDVKGYNSKKSLLHQIFRRYSLIVQNNLSNEDIRIRSKILGEAFGDDAEIIGKNTIDAMRSGVMLGQASMLDGMIQRYREVLGDDMTVIATGGIAGRIVRHCKEKIIYDENLLLDGLRFLYEKNQ